MRPLLAGLLALSLQVSTTADAQARETFRTGGHLKLFTVTSVPKEGDPLGEEASGQAVSDLRLKLNWRPIRSLRVELHPQLTLTHAGSALSGLQTGVQEGLPEALPLSADLIDEDAVQARARADRASVRLDQGPLRVTAGRQAVSFGKGRIFTPLDLVAAFRPTTLDTSYKPGVDALRLDLFQGVSGQVTLLGAYLGDWELDQSALVAHGKGSLGDWELEGFVGGLYGDLVLGTSAFYNAGAVGLYGDLNVTLPEDDSFIRALVGVQFKPSESTHLNAEVYIQTLGASEPDDYLLQYASPRFARGEVWLAGELYGAVAGQLELTPLVSLSGALIVNPLDTSALIMPSLVWSVSDNATANLGALVGLGRASAPAGPPVGLRLRSEFGHLHSTAFLSASVYF